MTKLQPHRPIVNTTNCAFVDGKVDRSFYLHVCLRAKKDASDNRLLQGVVVVMELGFIKHRGVYIACIYVGGGESLKPCCLADFHLLCRCCCCGRPRLPTKDRLKCGSSARFTLGVRANLRGQFATQKFHSWPQVFLALTPSVKRALLVDWNSMQLSYLRRR